MSGNERWQWGTANFSNVFSYLAYGSADVIAHQLCRIDQELDLAGCVQAMLYCSRQSCRAPQSVWEGAELHCDSTGNSTCVFGPIKRLKSQISVYFGGLNLKKGGVFFLLHADIQCPYRHHPGLAPHAIYTHCAHTLHRHISQQRWKANNTRRGFFDPCEAPSGADAE